MFNKHIRNFATIFFPIVLLAVFLFSHSNYTYSASTDAIALRVMPNPDHYSISRWYKEKGFKGSPQSLTVDGYEAVRDGRTVYVNVGNASGDNLYTNIYLISYNQGSETPTIDIFGQILSHWKFNTNIAEAGICSQSGGECADDNDCAQGYCNSKKAQVIRDTKRAGDLVETKIYLESYRDQNNEYPCLKSGSYLPNKTISTWPSWQETLGRELGLNPAPVDPINQLGDCQGYDKITCWNQETKRFADADLTNDKLDLPGGSYAYSYESNTNCSSFTIYGEFESGFKISFSGSISISSTSSIGGVSTNQPPVVSGENLPTGWSGKKYEGYITASDPDKDNLVWSLNIPKANWENSKWVNVSDAFLNTANFSMKKIYAEKAGQEGSYNFSVTLDDQKNKVNSKIQKNYTITVMNDAPVITTALDQELIIGIDKLNLNIEAKDGNSNYPLSFSVTGLPQGVSGSTVDQDTYKISGTAMDTTKDYPIEIIATDSYGKQSAPMSFNIKVTNNPPGVNTTSLPEAIACNNYSYQLSSLDPDGHSIAEHSISGLPGDMVSDNKGLVGGIPYSTGNFDININARDEYYTYSSPKSLAEGTKTLTLSVLDEVFSVSHNSTSGETIYVYPAGTSNVYYGPTQYNAQATTTAQGNVTYELQNNPSWLSIDAHTGAIQGTPINNTTDLGGHTVTIIATNLCGVSYTTTFNLTVLANEWCGDKKITSTEKCDDGNLTDGDGCSKSCTIEPNWTCGGSPSVCYTCGDNVCSPNETKTSCSKDCSFSWSIGVFGTCSNTCGDGTQSRTVVCKNGSSVTVSDSFCTTTKPTTSQNCTEYSGCPADSYGAWYSGIYVYPWNTVDTCDGLGTWMSPSPLAYAYTCPAGVSKTCWDTDWNNIDSGWAYGRWVTCYLP